MNIQITADKVDLSVEIKEMINIKIGHKTDQLLPDLNDEIKTAFVNIKRDKLGQYKISFDMLLPGKKGKIFAENQHFELIPAITGLREQIETQIKKYKEEQLPNARS
ncbi:MAG: HPF/RaiA family ribosome-associated protein [Candidatus Shapirobacteria bacterium]|nr:HPF/RaiA family ribosome-associated protein [Candidatus Shapirobacteria bacterium]